MAIKRGDELIIQGEVYSEGQVRPGARVVVRNTVWGKSLSVTTDARGMFAVKLPRSKGCVLVLASSGDVTGMTRVKIPKLGNPAAVRIDLAQLNWPRAVVIGGVSFFSSPLRTASATALLLIAGATAVDLGVFDNTRLGRFAFNNNLHVLRPELNRDRTLRSLKLPMDSRSRHRIRPGQNVTVIVENNHSLLWRGVIDVPETATLSFTGSGVVEMQPCASVLSLGRLLITGDDVALPIVFRPSIDSSRRQGFVLWGAGANQSAIRNARFERGDGSLLSVLDSYRSASETRFVRPQFPLPSRYPLRTARQTGGSLTIHNVDNVSISQSVFLDNNSNMGGAIAIFGSTDLKLQECRFEGNSAHRPDTKTSAGGAIYAVNATGLSIRRCEFVDNQALDQHSCGGAIYFGFGCQAQIDSTTFTSNHATWAGGAIYAIAEHARSSTDRFFVGAPDTGRGEVSLTLCSFNENTICSSAGGSAIRIDEGYAVDVNHGRLTSLDATRTPFIVSGVAATSAKPFARVGALAVDSLEVCHDGPQVASIDPRRTPDVALLTLDAVRLTAANQDSSRRTSDDGRARELDQTSERLYRDSSPRTDDPAARW